MGFSRKNALFSISDMSAAWGKPLKSSQRGSKKGSVKKKLKKTPKKGLFLPPIFDQKEGSCGILLSPVRGFFKKPPIFTKIQKTPYFYNILFTKLRASPENPTYPRIKMHENKPLLLQNPWSPGFSTSLPYASDISRKNKCLFFRRKFLIFSLKTCKH